MSSYDKSFGKVKTFCRSGQSFSVTGVCYTVVKHIITACIVYEAPNLIYSLVFIHW